jgi:3-hydroxyisobutyrate dehydrogenase-like beta-hydroxyacid dehydrogenase
VAELAEGRTTFLAAGADADLDQAKPVLDLLGRETIRLGPLGAAMGAKVIINAVVHAEMVVLIEALALAKRVGLSGTALAALLERPAGLMRPLAHRVKQRILAGDYEGGMSTANARKDSRLALELAAATQVPIPLLAATDPIYAMGVAAGLGGQDYAALARLWEGWIGASLAEPPA